MGVGRRDVELEPLFSTFFETQDRGRLAEELRPAFMQDASPSQKEQFRAALEESGIVELGHRGTRRFSPWRRALACEMLGKIGARRSVPVVLARLEDRRPGWGVIPRGEAISRSRRRS